MREALVKERCEDERAARDARGEPGGHCVGAAEPVAVDHIGASGFVEQDAMEFRRLPPAEALETGAREEAGGGVERTRGAAAQHLDPILQVVPPDGDCARLDVVQVGAPDGLAPQLVVVDGPQGRHADPMTLRSLPACEAGAPELAAADRGRIPVDDMKYPHPRAFRTGARDLATVIERPAVTRNDSGSPPQALAGAAPMAATFARRAGRLSGHGRARRLTRGGGEAATDAKALHDSLAVLERGLESPPLGFGSCGRQGRAGDRQGRGIGRREGSVPVPRRPERALDARAGRQVDRVTGLEARARRRAAPATHDELDRARLLGRIAETDAVGVRRVAPGDAAALDEREARPRRGRAEGPAETWERGPEQPPAGAPEHAQAPALRCDPTEWRARLVAHATRVAHEAVRLHRGRRLRTRPERLHRLASSPATMRRAVLQAAPGAVLVRSSCLGDGSERRHRCG